MRKFLPTLLLLAMGPAAAAAPASVSPAAQLDALMARAWQQHLANNPVEASLDGYHQYDGLWPDPSIARQKKAKQETRDNLAALEKIDPNALDPAEQLNYRMFEYSLQDSLAGDEQPDNVILMMNQLGGPQLTSELTQQLRFDTPTDYENWLKRLQTVDTYLAAFTQRLQQALAQGISQPDVVVKRIPGEIAGEIVKNPVDSPFYAPFKQMPDTIRAAEQAKLRTAAQAAITDVVNPAFAKFAKFVNDDYLPKARKTVGALALPHGKSYYAYAVKHYTTTDMTPEQVHQLGLQQVAKIQAEMQALFAKIGFKGTYPEFLNHLRTDPEFYYTKPADLLEAYRAAAKKVDPELVKIAGTWLLPRVPYGVRPIPAAEAPNTYPAYSVPPAGDFNVAGYVGVNLYKPESRPKYDIQVLMCHEGRPGHQLQIPVAMQLDNLPAFRRFAYYNVYGEGWALYSETLCNELGLYDNEYSEFGYLNYQMWRAARLVVDTGLHYYGWSRAQAIQYMQQHTALSDENITNEVDRYIAWPGQALSYMIGELEILRLRDEAKQKLGDKYTLRDFDDVVLGEGSLPMAVMSDVVDRWIADTRAGKPADQLPYAAKPRSLGSSPASNPQSASDPAPSGSSQRSEYFAVIRAHLVDPTTIDVYYTLGYVPCYGKLGAVDVKQAHDRITVALHRHYLQSADPSRVCAQFRQTRSVEITLNAPLNGRAVVDGSDGKTVPVQ